ncbi:SAM-dependent methyltransferase [Yimella sp. cx-51]|uniref:SAM-dependent methyltransferase n=1 Tax=Yimella sp. cx-51 TaxID=2770551 RepID=UPI00165E1071|nr:SAM-dependent methyltransferase [Yimella sp. cx-51]MBC9956384.1 SAM-dependent methyltransferase [Yimella sp. cx-51]QTH38497.1 SAM-dependent methyltransferase [Yimella sp. cx-51]
MPTPRPLPLIWHEALYGEAGFYRRPEGPAGHFATSSQGLPGVDELLAECVLALCRRHNLRGVVEIGCGRGELLILVHRMAPDLELTGVDIVDRPHDLPADIAWLRSPGGDELPEQLNDLRETLVFAHEWLDVVPCEIAVATDDGVRVVGVVDDSLLPARPLSSAETAWCERHWPTSAPVVEIGLARDKAYDGLRRRLTDGLLVCVDYGHTRTGRPSEGTFVGYRDGSICPPAFDGSSDLTAHVAMDSLGADHIALQADMARELLDPPDRPDHALAGQDPQRYLEALRRRSAWTAFTAPSGLGGFWWAIETIT